MVRNSGGVGKKHQLKNRDFKDFLKICLERDMFCHIARVFVSCMRLKPIKTRALHISSTSNGQSNHGRRTHDMQFLARMNSVAQDGDQ